LEIKKILLRKEAKLLTLLLTSMLIASASAAVYYSMIARSTTTVSVAAVYFTTGNDSSGVATIGTNSTYVSLALSAYPNVTLTYEQAVNLTASANKQIQLSHSSISPGDGDPTVSNFTSIVFRLIRGDGSVAGTLTYDNTDGDDQWTEPTSGTGYVAITSGQEWTIKVEIKAGAGANTGVATTIEISVDVR